MPEKQAKGFGQSEKNQMFTLDTEGQKPLDESGKQIILNIAQAQGNKLLLHQKTSYVRFTGNPLIDTYRRFNDFLIDHSKVKIRDKATIFRLLAVMINSGLSLIRSLKTLGLQMERSPRLARALFEMAQAIEGGKSFSQAMEMYPDVFNEAQIGMVHAGEASGQLNKTLKDLAEETEKSAGLNSKVKSALIYPIVVLCLLVVVIFIMMIAVIPQLTKLFLQTGHELPLPTQILITVSAFTSEYWYVIIGATFALIGAFMFWKRTHGGKYLWDLIKLRIPVFGNLIQKAVLSKFARSFSSMMGSGVPIIKSIEIVANAVGNEAYKRRLYLTAEDMKKGIPMAENMTGSKLFPSMLVNMIEVGEQTAQIESVMLKIAEFYDDDVDNAAKALTKTMEPLIIGIIGVTVGGLVAAIMLPIIQLTNITGGFS